MSVFNMIEVVVLIVFGIGTIIAYLILRGGK
jgi:hypothetical protein